MKTAFKYRLLAACLGFDRAKGDGVKTMTLPQFLTEAQIAHAARLYKVHGADHALAPIQARVIEPNMAAINAKLGQENDARYLAYAVVYVLSQLNAQDLARAATQVAERSRS